MSGADQQQSSYSAVGIGEVHDPASVPLAMGQNGSREDVDRLPAPATEGFGRRGWGDGPMPSRTHYFLTRSEVLKGVANRFVHSTAYLYFYASMALASIATVVLSLLQDCPGTLFYALELAINVGMIVEVGIRLTAFGKQFWKSTFNIIDLALVLLCAITLAVIFFSHDCSPFRRGSGGAQEPGEGVGSQHDRDGRGEELLDSVLLIGRNVIQCFRLLAVVRRSGSSVASRVPAIDLSAARGLSLDIDLEDEGALARERMADGGDPGARARMENARRERESGNGSGNSNGNGWKGDGRGQEERALFDVDDDEEL